MTYIKALIAVAISFVLVGCVDVKETILSKKDAVVLIVNKGKGGMGTGFFIGDNIIVTNYHVVDGNKDIEIKTEKGNKFYAAEIVKSDEFADIAIVKIKDWEDFIKNNTYIPLEFNNSYRQLDDVYAIGHPWSLTWSISKGVISAEVRFAPVPKFLLQTDAHVYQGNSGGPLLNQNGEVIGINSNMLANEGGSYGLAIPSILIQKVLNDLEKYNEVRWPVIGVTLDSNIVIEVNPLSPAFHAGIKEKDVILAVQTKYNRYRVFNSEDLISRLAVTDYQDPITIVVKRNEKLISIVVEPSYKKSSDFKTDLTKK